ncbi:epoxide hydrolase N-terminal domain-containing protein [Actinoallomurus acaciae]|uniref:Epoxide hydrolase N-terminal domain-containing protein n=1 Tax=Actinoallomurus acaciae TaxID=502577 RepID=A0ABV5YEN1_9ACTN
MLADLRYRIRRTRFTPASSAEPWAAGTDPAYLRSLLDHWAGGFDRRKAEDELNRLPHHLADIDGQRIHFVHVRAAGGRPALPLILTHGWPSSFVEMLPLVPLLTDPARFGGDPADAFDVVIPSPPGFLFSELPPRRPMTGRSEEAEGTDPAVAPSGAGGLVTRQTIAETWHTLMTEELGSVRTPSRPRCRTPPAGLAAWIVDELRAWSDCGGDLESRFDRDDILTVLTLYWATGTIGSPFRQYYDWPLSPPRPVVTVPAGVTLSAGPVLRDMPRSLAERGLTDLRQWRGPTVGGHFMPVEEPTLLAGDLRTLFRSLR